MTDILPTPTPEQLALAKHVMATELQKAGMDEADAVTMADVLVDVAVKQPNWMDPDPAAVQEAFAKLTKGELGDAPAENADKDFSLGSPSGVVMAPFDLGGAGKPPKRKKKAAKDAPAAALTAEPIAAGVALRATNTGRVLMLQRALGDNDGMPDANAGKWELPGGHINPGETPWAGASREFAEEVGQPLPDDAKVSGTWTSPDGVYAGFVVDTADEDGIDINADAEARQVSNPDGDRFETCAWTDPTYIAQNPAMRHEVAQMDTRVLGVPPAPVVAFHGVSKAFVESAKPGMLYVEDIEMAAVVDPGALAGRPMLEISGLAKSASGLVVVPARTVLEVTEVADGVVRAVVKDFDESRHPRDDHGRFTSGGGDGGGDKPTGDARVDAPGDVLPPGGLLPIEPGVGAGPGRMEELRTRTLTFEDGIRLLHQSTAYSDENMRTLMAHDTHLAAAVQHSTDESGKVQSIVQLAGLVGGVLLGLGAAALAAPLLLATALGALAPLATIVGGYIESNRTGVGGASADVSGN